MTQKHIHDFQAKRENATVLVCNCGKWKNVISNENPAIEEQKHRGIYEI